MDKSPDAFRTISEVADALETPAHVLRFWESRFPQIKPVKRAGGRRYYRPADVALLGGIRHLLHDEGITIRGVQKILREQGVRHVAAMAPDVDLAALDAMEAEDDLILDLSVSGETPFEVTETGQILAMEAAGRRITLRPEVTAEVVRLHHPFVPQDLSEGFVMPTANRRPLPSLDPEPSVDDVPEAGYVWVEDDEDATTVEVLPLFPAEAAVRSLTDLSEPGPIPTGLFADLFNAAPERQAASDRGLDLVPEAVTQTFATELDLRDPEPSEGPEFPAAEEAPELADALAMAAPPGLAGVAARLRALPLPLLPQALVQMAELQARLGLLHAQMIEALRTRR